MALVKCYECDRNISDQAAACPHCGAPVRVEAVQEIKRAEKVSILLNSKKRTNHILHLLLTVVTAGLWIPIWILVGLSNSLENRKIDSQLGV